MLNRVEKEIARVAGSKFLLLFVSKESTPGKILNTCQTINSFYTCSVKGS